MLFETQLALFIARPAVHCGLKYQHWPMIRTRCPERLSVAYCTHIIQTNLMLKNRRYPEKLMFAAITSAHRRAYCSAGVICRGCGVVTCNTQPSVY